MPEQYERVQQFFDAINSDAQERQAEIDRKLGQRRIDAISKARVAAEAEARAMIMREIKKAQTAANREIAEHSAAAKKALAEKRSEIARRVFDEAKERLGEFTKSDSYLEFLLGSAEAAKEVFGEDGVVFLLREADMQYSEKISKAYGKKCSFVKDASIEIGGLKIKNAAGTAVADDTLDARLSAQHGKFLENSGMSVRKA